MALPFGYRLFLVIIVLFAIITVNSDKLVAIPFSILLSIVMYYYGTYYFGSIWEPAPMDKVRKMVSAVSVRNKTVYDLGSGDGRVIILAAKKGARAYGVEIDFLRYLLSLYKIRKAKSNAKVFLNSFFLADLREADVVFMHLQQETVWKLEDKFLKELKKGARVVSYIFRCRKLKLVKSMKKEQIYIYRIP
ncbi:MAG: SAM-dependent methyltransferase [Candidatus Aenigmarchaeota archaeon]|nr:SAM-dependent methyltransferase [Candidatus Aenigmarchaeota archaeon]